MAEDEEQPHEGTRLLPARKSPTPSLISSHFSKEEQLLAHNSVGDRLPYNNYTTIDWLHDLVCIDGTFRR